jgi:hypothetical protein
VTLHSTRHAPTAPEATPHGNQGPGPAGELDLALRERLLLAVGVHIACATIAIVDWPTSSRRGRPN